MSLRKKARTKTVPMAFRCPVDLYEYVKRTASSPGKRGEVVRDAVALDRDLADRLAPLTEKLEKYALHAHLNMGDDLAEVIAQLATYGLAVWEMRELLAEDADMVPATPLEFAESVETEYTRLRAISGGRR